MPVNMSLATRPKEKVVYTLHVDILLTFVTKATVVTESKIKLFFPVYFFRHSLEQHIHLAHGWRHSVVWLAVLADAY